jgi:hypothetical protein
MALFALLVPGSAHADIIWNFDFKTEGGLTFDGSLTTGDYSSLLGGYQVTGMSGTMTAPLLFDGGPVTLLAPDSFWGNDNILLAGAPWVTGNGIAFLVSGSSSTQQFSLFNDLFAGVSLGNDDWSDIPNSFDVSLAAPEPAGAGLLAGGLGLILWIGRRARTGTRRLA